MLLSVRLVAAAATMLALASPASAQSTDGFHEIQVVPVVVDSASFSQRFDFRAVLSIISGTVVAELHPRYYPADGTTQPGPIDCPSFQVGIKGKSFDGLRAMCPGLTAGSQFGFLVIEQHASEHLAFSVFSRVSNPAGAGFAVEAFPAHTFTTARSTAAGLRRKSASAGSPAYQSNCFVGLMGEHASVTTPTRVLAGLLGPDGLDLGTAVTLDLHPGQMVRLLDVFAAVGAPEGDHDHATFFTRPVIADGDPRPGVIAFCTVQDNTSFGADFRIAKQEYGDMPGISVPLPAGWDEHVQRVTLSFRNIVGPEFSLNTGGMQQNTHLFYFRNPDWISCELTDPATFSRMLPAKGLEMRLLAWDAHGYTPIAGGAGVLGWDRVYLGDKRERGDGSNTAYLLQVENMTYSPGGGGDVPYGLRCWSGSGHTRGDMITYRRSASDF